MPIVSLLDPHPADQIALIEGDEQTTYGELRDLVAETRSGLVAAGLTAGDRVAIIFTNTRSSVVSLLAVIGAGMVAVPLNPSSPPRELERELEMVSASLVLVGSEDAADLSVRTSTPAGTIVPGVEPLPKGPPVDRVVLTGEHLAVMLFTSGTAGAPKPAMLSYGCLVFLQRSIIDHPRSDVDTETVNLAILPLSHVYGLNVSLLTTLRAGGTVVLAHRFSPTLAVELVARHKVTHFAGVPPMWRAFLDSPDIPDDAFAGVRRMTSGAAALPRDLFDAFLQRFGVELSEGYGLTETASGVTSHLGIPIRPGSVGQAWPGVEVRVVDYDDRPAPVDDSGVVKVRGPNVFLGYWNDEEATKAVLDDDGWLNTGDIGVLSEDGYLYLVDRAKDLIIVSGFNVYPYEVEEVLNRHPAVDQCVVVGRLDEQRGERVVAYITVADGQTAPTLDEVVDFCREELARYKCPTELKVVDTLPIAPSGKPVRRDLI